MKYKTLTIGSIITAIIVGKDKGYTSDRVLESKLPEDHYHWGKRKATNWIAANNKRMTAICEFLNENNL